MSIRKGVGLVFGFRGSLRGHDNKAAFSVAFLADGKSVISSSTKPPRRWWGRREPKAAWRRAGGMKSVVKNHLLPIETAMRRQRIDAGTVAPGGSRAADFRAWPTRSVASGIALFSQPGNASLVAFELSPFDDSGKRSTVPKCQEVQVAGHFDTILRLRCRSAISVVRIRNGPPF